MPDDSTFAELADRLKQRDEAAASLLYERFAKRLVGLANLHLQDHLRAKVDPEDVMQSAWKSFFRRHAAGEFDLRSWDSLWSLLTVITVRKCSRRAEYYRAARRDVRREIRAPGSDDEGDASGLEGTARDASPYETAVLTEMVEHLFRGLQGRECRIVQYSLEGHPAPEIAARVGVSERSVYRLMERIKARLERLNAEEADA